MSDPVARPFSVCRAVPCRTAGCSGGFSWMTSGARLRGCSVDTSGSPGSWRDQRPPGNTRSAPGSAQRLRSSGRQRRGRGRPDGSHGPGTSVHYDRGIFSHEDFGAQSQTSRVRRSPDARGRGRLPADGRCESVEQQCE